MLPLPAVVDSLNVSTSVSPAVLEAEGQAEGALYMHV